MGLSWRNIVIIVGISFSLGGIAASHKVILAHLSQATAALSALDLPGTQTKPRETQKSTPSFGSSSTAVLSRSRSNSSSQALKPTPIDFVPDSVFTPERGDIRVIVFSDINGRYRSTTYRQEVINSIRLIPAWKPDLVLCAGDVVAGQLISLTPENLQTMWNGFDRTVFQPIRRAGVPFAIAMGQHDGSNQVFEEDALEETNPTFLEAQGIPSGVPGTYVFAQERNMAKAYWTDPARDLGIEMIDETNFPFRYSFVHNNLFALVWDASSAEISDDDLTWAEQQLSSPAAQQAKVRLSLSHLPLYAIAQGRDRPRDFLTQGPDIQELLETYKVQAHISGHHHAYYPGHVGDVELLYSGALGAGPRTLLGSDRHKSDEASSDPPLRTLTVMDIFFDRSSQEAFDSTNLILRSPVSTVYTTYDMGTMKIIDPDNLPRVVAGPTGLVLRQGIERRDLTYEDNRRYRRSW